MDKKEVGKEVGSAWNLVNVELWLAATHLSVTGAELSDKVVSENKKEGKNEINKALQREVGH